MKSIGLLQMQREDLRQSSEPRLKLTSGLFFTDWKNLLERTTSFFTNQLQMKKNHLLVIMKRICQLCSWLMMKPKRTSTGNATGLGSKYITFYAFKKEFICKLFFFCKSHKTFPFQWYKERRKPNPSSSYVYYSWMHVMASLQKLLKSDFL